MSESLSVYGRYVVGLLSVWVRDCRSAVGYESSIVLMIGFQSVSCRLSIGLKSGDSIPNLTRHEPDWFYGVFSNIVGGRQLADSVKNLCFLSVSCRFGRCDWGMTGQLKLGIILWNSWKICHVEIHNWCCSWLCKFTSTWCWSRVFTRLQRVLVVSWF